MKNKKWVYMLLPLAIVVWGMIAYRIIDALSETETGDNTPLPMVNKRSDFTLPDSMVLSLNYRDPFLGSAKLVKQSSTLASKHPAPAGATVSVSVPTSATPPLVVAWPTVQYMGVIHNGTSQARVALLRINGKTHMVSEGEQASGIKVKAIARDSVGLVFSGNFKYVKK